jgi:hypothetical protein
VGAAGNDQGLHVVGGELHRVRCLITQAVLAADAQHGQGQPPFLALLVLRDGGVERGSRPVPFGKGTTGGLRARRPDGATKCRDNPKSSGR